MPAIYVITNKINNKKYIGKTEKTIEGRFKGHEYASRYYDSYLYKSFREYGIENFFINKIEECSLEELNSREIYHISEQNTMYPNGYNMTAGGEGGNTSLSESYVASMKKRDYSGSNNPMYGRRGENNPKFGRKYGAKPNISKGTKANWDNNPDRKKQASKRLSGENNPMFGKTPKNALQIEYNSVIYYSLSAAMRATGLSAKKLKTEGTIL